MKTIIRVVFAVVLATGLMTAGEPGDQVRVELHDTPLAEAVRKIEDVTGRKIDAPPGLLDGKTINFVARGTVDELLNKFGTAIDVTHSIALVHNGSGYRLKPFVRAKPASVRPAPRGGRLSIDVLEGTVALQGGRGRVLVRSGEHSSVAAGTLPTEPTPFDTALIAPWRFSDAPASFGLEASIPISGFRFRLLGYAGADPIVECETVDGSKRTLDFSALDIPEADRRKIVGENGELNVQQLLRLMLDKVGK